MLLLTNDLSNSGSTWTEMIAACRPQAQREAVEKRSTDSPSYPFLYRHITFYRIQCTQDGMKIVLLFFIRKKDAGLCHVSHQLSPQFTFNLMNPIIFVCLPWGCLPPQRKSGNVLFCILHTFNQDKGFVDSNLTLCDLQISRRRGLCTGMWGECLSRCDESFGGRFTFFY